MSCAGEVDPELEAGHAAFLLLGHLGVDDAAPGGHPLHAAGLEQADVADAVAVPHAALEHDRHGLEAAVRVVGKAADVVARGVAAERVEHQERIEALLQRLGQDARQLDAGAVATSAWPRTMRSTARERKAVVAVAVFIRTQSWDGRRRVKPRLRLQRRVQSRANGAVSRDAV